MFVAQYMPRFISYLTTHQGTVSGCSVSREVRTKAEGQTIRVPVFNPSGPELLNGSVYPSVHSSRTRHALSMAAENGHDKFKFTALPTDALGNLKNKSKDSVELFQKW